MLALLSNGITSPALKEAMGKYLIGKKTAAVVVTADNEYKKRNHHIPRVVSELNSYGLETELFDLDSQSPDLLLDYDVVEFIGGNPYYLLNSIRRCDAASVLEQLAKDKVLIGWSAGALVMSSSIAVIDVFEPQMNFINLTDLKGLCLADVHLVPHYSKFLHRYEAFEEKLRRYEADNNCTLVRLNDGDGMLFEGGDRFMIKSNT